MLAVVLGLFAHQGALAQTSTRLTTLDLSAGTLDPLFDPDEQTYTADVLFDVTQVMVTASAEEGASVTFPGTDDADFGEPGHQVNLVNRTTRITVRVTNGSATRNYTITVTRTTTPGAPG